MKLSNKLTIIRFILVPIIAFLLYSEHPFFILLSIVFFVIATLSDWLDGFVARIKEQISVFGTFFDPIVDKMLVLAIFFIFSDLDLIPIWIVLIILFRELLVSGVRQVCSTPKRIISANWMGKSKFIMQTFVILYVQIFLYLKYTNQLNPFFTEIIIYYFALIMTIISLIFALNFVYWYRKEITSDL